MRWIKRLLKALVVLVLLLIVAAFVLRGLYKSDKYRRPAYSPQRQAELAGRMIDKIAQTMDFAGRTANQSDPQPYTLSITADEMNAALADFKDRPEMQKLSQVIQDPGFTIEKDRLVLAGYAPDYGTVLSLHLEPSIDAQGRFRLTIVKAAAGRISVPRDAWERPLKEVIPHMQQQLPALQRHAKMEPSGIMNGPAGAAVASILAIDLLSAGSAEAVIPIGQPTSQDSIPVRLKAIQLAPGVMTVTLQPLTMDQKREYFDRLKTRR